ncbi:MAG: hypothetical protein L6Q92_11220 [Phycisphaerae bacterium]|nr:hypothetical protein [Phycisphaerae bacterium]
MIRRDSKFSRVFPWVFAVVILGPAGYGFVEKLTLFILAVKRDLIAGFTLFPVVNYLIVTAGMVCLMVWAVANGMFRDVEKPKYDMLNREALLDEIESGEDVDDSA